MDLEYRKCNSDDLVDLIAISKQTFMSAFEKDNDPEDFKNYIDKAFSKSKITNELENLNSIFYFVYINTKLIGYFKLNKGDAQNETFKDSSIELERIYIINNYQNKGFGQHVLNYIIELSKQMDIQFLWLGVWEKNKSAIIFYERFGFIKFDTHPYYIGSDKQTDWLMKLKFD